MKTTVPAPSKSSYPFPVSQAWYDSVCARLADTLDAERLPEALERLNECMAGHYDPCDEPDVTLRLVFKLLLPEIEKAVERSRRARSRRRVRGDGASPRAPRKARSAKSLRRDVSVPLGSVSPVSRAPDAAGGDGMAPAQPDGGEVPAIPPGLSRPLNRRERRRREMERRRLARRR